MNNIRSSLPDNTNRHALIRTHSLSRFTLPRCALHSDNPGLWDMQLSSRDFCEIIAKVMTLIRRVFLGFRASHGLPFPTRGNARLDMHTQTHSAAAVMMYAAVDFRDSSSVRSSLSALNANFLRPLLSFLLHMTVSLTTQASPEFKNFSANTTALGCFHVSQTTQAKSKFHWQSQPL